MPERRGRTVPEALLRGLAHGAGDVLAVLAGDILVEDTDDLTHQGLRGIIPRRLGDRDDLDACLLEPANGHLHLGTVAIETREGMDADHVEGALG